MSELTQPGARDLRAQQSNKIAQAVMPKPAIIPPTNGRIVWFTPATDMSLWPKGFEWKDQSQKLAAKVCHVWGPRMVNLLVTDSDGNQHAFSSVDLLQPADAPDIYARHGRYCEWMPYQQGQAAKA